MSANEELLARLDAAAKGHDIPSDVTPPGLRIWMKVCADAAAAIRALEARVESVEGDAVRKCKAAITRSIGGIHASLAIRAIDDAFQQHFKEPK